MNLPSLYWTVVLSSLLVLSISSSPYLLLLNLALSFIVIHCNFQALSLLYYSIGINSETIEFIIIQLSFL